MNQKQNRPVENEYRSSQVYKTLTGTGIPVADKLAQGLGRAAAGIDAALNAAAPVVKSAAQGYQTGRNGGGTYRYPSQGQPQPGQAPVPPAGGQTARPQPTQGPVPPAGGQTARPQPAQGPMPPAGGQTARRQPAQPRRPAGVSPAPPPQMPPMKVVHMGSPAKYYITGVVALLYAMNVQMMEASEWAVFAIVVALVFFLSGALFRGKKRLVPIEEPKPQPQPKPEPEPKKEPEPKPEKKSQTGNPEVDKIIDEGHDMIKKLRAANDAIPDEALSADIDRMERASADIFNYIAQHPGKAPQIRKFMNYYLPTTLKLLGSYEQLSKQSVKGENITSTLFNIAGMMHTVADAFEKQLDSLFTDEAMDISADITVFETMLKQEGFVEEKKGRL